MLLHQNEQQSLFAEVGSAFRGDVLKGLESLIDRFVEQLDQVFMLRVFHVDTIW
jgi:hypothetical protein